MDGPVREEKYRGFVGAYSIPVVHGMTVGELARFLNGELKMGCDLTVIPLKGWKRSLLFRETGLPWVPTSPHIPTPEAALTYGTLGTVGCTGAVSIGVYYTLPFQVVGAPWMKAEVFARELAERKLPGCFFRPIYFTPYFGKYENEECKGVQIHVREGGKYRPVSAAIHIMDAIAKLYPDEFAKAFQPERKQAFDKVIGTARVREQMEAGSTAEEILTGWKDELEKFEKKRKKYLLYGEKD